MSDLAPAVVERLAYRPPEVAAVLGISKSRVYELMASGRLEYRQISTQVRLIPRTAIEAFLAGDAG